ncbi:MAG: ligase-associated DNA damage response exonuclease [Anaerolineales bacterium]|nr:ligase-associated DNA damage response exonuclease [Anaerolineales bacterium]MCB9126415.1 ligase-associated DNA damage response exonuclease [Ardenticatenales bacterium]MCB9171576.1 ligase-associated DNA damage response exonuclease [Ardenticatenales bacterium]
MSLLLELNDHGLYCAAGDFYIDPWQPVHRALVTHAHADHSRPGSAHYLIAEASLPVSRWRLGAEAPIETIPYHKPIEINGVRISYHPAGHIIGSAQIRVEYRGEVWVASGDYKIAPDPTCAPFEPVPCHTFITEATFGLPIYRWPEEAAVFGEVNDWWRQNQADGKASVIFAYALGKAQRVMTGIDPTIGPIFVHGAVNNMNRMVAQAGLSLPHSTYVNEAPAKTDWSQALIIAPTSARGTPWLRRFGAISTAFASGWMLVRGQRRRRSVDRGFVLSDHVDWEGLMLSVAATGAERVLVTHGNVPVVARYLREARGIEAYGLATPYGTDDDDATAEESE